MGSYRLTWREHGGGHLALGHKPGKKLRKALDETGCTLVVNLLSDKESRASVSSRRVRFPLDTARPPGPERDAEALALLRRMRAELAGGGKVFVHCSAGLHRTGMLAFAYFRHDGLPPEQALAAITALRPLTAAELTEERMAWGERFAGAAESSSAH